MKESKILQALNRRRFAGVLTGAASIAPGLLAQQPSSTPVPTHTPSAAAPNPNTTVQRRSTVDEIAPFAETLEFKRSDVALKVEPFPMTEVRLLGGAYLQVSEWNRGYMHRLTADRLVRKFQLNAGLPSSAQPLGGWEEDILGHRGELRGHFTGHYLSAAALGYASTVTRSLKPKATTWLLSLPDVNRS